MAAIGWIWYRNAWITDDPFITFRTVEQLLAGHGLRFNVHERVQAFTHPLWLALLVPLRAAGLPLPAAAFLLSALAVAGALALLWRVLGRDPVRWSLAALLLFASRTLADFTSSGLETPLALLLVVAFARATFAAGETGAGRRPLWPVALLAAALALTRLDLALLALPALALLATERGRIAPGRAAAELAAGLAPLVAWLLFAAFYYGSPWPNTALAKLGSGVPRGALAAQGWSYLTVTARWDSLWLPLLAAAAYVAWRGGRVAVALAAGGALHALYVITIGGDFMVGRFWQPATALALVLAVRGLPARGVRWGTVVAAAALLLPHSALFTGEGYAPAWRLGSSGRTGIVDEKGNPPGSEWLRDLLLRGWPAPATEPLAPPRVEGVLGRPGYRAHLLQILVDPNALADPLLARLPCTPPWQIGHFRRPVPAGYLESLATGSNRIADAGIAALFADVRTVVSGPLLGPGRVAAALRLALRPEAPMGSAGRCPGFSVRAPGAAPTGRRLPVGGFTRRLEGSRVRLAGRAPAGADVTRWRLEVEAGPAVADARMRCTPRPNDAAVAFEIELELEDPGRAEAAAAAARVDLVLATPAGSGPG